jgi:16S rRNA (guanine527-N7)-methyltransferase
VTPAEFRRETGVSRETLARFEVYLGHLQKWQSRINLVGAGTLTDAWRRHFFDSAQLYPLLPAVPTDRPLVLYDLGSGAGFPGLVLALQADDGGRALATHLVESDSRKCAFLIEAVRLTGLTGKVQVHATRAETLGRQGAQRADVVTARALTSLTELIALAAPLLHPQGLSLFLKGARVGDELTLARKTWKMHADLIPSRSDSSGTIVRLMDIGRDRPIPTN